MTLDGTRRARKVRPPVSAPVAAGAGAAAGRTVATAAPDKGPLDRFVGVTATRVPVQDGRLTAEDARRAEAAERARQFLTAGNDRGDFRLRSTVEVDPGSPSSVGTDRTGRDLWVVDQSVTFPNAPADVVDRFFGGFFTGRAHGRDGSGPRMKLRLLDDGEGWKRPGAGANGSAGVHDNPLADPSLERFVVEVYDVRPMPGSGTIMPTAGLEAVVYADQTKKTADSCEFTLHFLNPERREGPFPGAADGAVRYRCTRNPDGSATVDAYYLTAAARDFTGPLSDYVAPMKMGRAFVERGAGLLKHTPLGLFGAMAKGMMAGLETVADVGVRMSGGGEAARLGVSKAHAAFYRKTLLKNAVYG